MLNEIIGVASRYPAWLTRKFSIVGGSPSPQITPEFTPVVPVPFNEEDRWSLGEFLWGRSAIIAATALTAGGAQLRNPAGSGILATVEQTNLEGNAVRFSYLIVATTADLATVRVGLPRDGRLNQAARNSVCIFSSDNTFASTASAGYHTRVINAGNSDVVDTVPAVLGPGDAVFIRSEVINTQLYIGFTWRERLAAPGELQL